MTQAARNANDGISIAQTTEGALNEINNNLQRVRELTVQASTGSNSPTDLKSIQAEIQLRMDEIDRVSEQTQFNGVKVLASDNALKVQVGAHDNETININLKKIDSTTLGLGGFSVGNTELPVSGAVTEIPGATAGDPGFKINLDAAASALKLDDASSLSLHRVTDSTTGAPTGDYVVRSGNDYYAASVDAATGNVTLNTADINFQDTANGVSTDVALTDQLVRVGVNESGNVSGMVSIQGRTFDIGGDALVDAGDATGTQNAAFATTIHLSGTTETSQFKGSSTVDPLAKLDAALAQVDTLRGELGAVQNRFQSTVTNLNNTVTNLSAARSRIEDADYAVEVSNMTRAQILQQAGTSVLAQANQVPQTVLSLLR